MQLAERKLSRSFMVNSLQTPKGLGWNGLTFVWGVEFILCSDVVMLIYIWYYCHLVYSIMGCLNWEIAGVVVK